MQQCHRMCHHLYERLIVGIRLRFVQRFYAFGMRDCAMVQPAHFLLVSDKNLPSLQCLDNSGRGMSDVHQFLPRHLSERCAGRDSAHFIDTCQLQVRHQDLYLLRRPLHGFNDEYKRTAVP